MNKLDDKTRKNYKHAYTTKTVGGKKVVVNRV